jgi:hypothetical protein
MKQSYRVILSATCALSVLCGLCAALLSRPHETSAREAEVNPASQSVPDVLRSDAHLNVSRTSPELTVIRLESPQIQIQKQRVGVEDFDAFSIAGESVIMEDGSPALPQVTRFYAIPNVGGVDLVVTAAEYDEISHINPLPFAEDQRVDQTCERKAEIYNSDAWYPPNPAQISEPMILRDFRVVMVTLYPVQVNPVTRQARIYRRLEVNVVSNNESAPNELTVSHRPSGAWVPIYRRAIANLDEVTLTNATTVPGSYLILCRSDTNVRVWADSLYEWKTRQGFKAVINAQTIWTATTMASAIQNAYNLCDPPLEYVAIIGDPLWSFGLPTHATAYDHYFALCSGNDELEDISVGRLCAESLAQMAVINAKTMSYERTPFIQDTAWFRNGLFYCGVSNSVASNWTLIQWGAQQFREWTGVTNCIAANYTTDINETQLMQWFGDGLSFFFWRGSDSGQLIGTAVGNLPSSWKLPVCILIGEFSGSFTSSTCVAEAFVSAGTPTQPRGGVAAIGLAGASDVPPSVALSGGLMYSIANMGIENLGIALVSTKILLNQTFGFGSTIAINYSRYANLLGEPSLSMWTDVPIPMNATFPDTLAVGSRSVTVTVTRQADSSALAEALVVLWKRGADSMYVRGFTDDAGRITFPLNINSTGDLLLTVTKHNHAPYLATIPCVAAAQMPMYTSYTLDDDNVGGTLGNGDHIINPGEVADLWITLRNFGTTATVQNITVQLTSDNDHVQVQQASAVYPDLAPGDSAVGDAAFRFFVNPLAQNEEPLQFTLTISSQTDTTSGCVELICAASEIAYASHTFSAPFDPGTTRDLQVTVTNKGMVPMSGADGHLLSRDLYVGVADGSASYGNIAAGATVTNATDVFTVHASSRAFPGHQASMLLILTTDIGHADSTQFTITIGTADSTDPSGPDAYGYYAFDNLDTSYADSAFMLCPQFQYVDISGSLGENLNLLDLGEKTSITQIWSTARALPFSFKFYGTTYDSITVCSNGWMAFGNQAWNDIFRNHRIPGMQAPDALIAPYWDDLKTSGTNQGVWFYSDTENHRVIVQWKASAGNSYGTPLDFEVILYDTVGYPTRDGNGLILVQYNDVVMNLEAGSGSTFNPSGCTVGIQAPRGLVGLEYAYQATYAAGAATIQDGRAILFTSNSQMVVGNIAGTVTDAETGVPLPGAIVHTEGWANSDTTDFEGTYLLTNVVGGIQSISAEAYRYNCATTEVFVAADSTAQLNFSLTHPEFALSTDSISAATTGQPLDTTFDIINDGNGPFDYTISVFYPGENLNTWDTVSTIPVTEITGDNMIMGCEFVNGTWWVTGSGNTGGQNMFYRFDRNGNALPPIPQPTTTAVGWFDLANDGQYVYGSDSWDLVGVDLDGVARVSIPSPLNPARGVAYDAATNHFWVADYATNFFEIDRSGAIVQQIANEDALQITGLAWNSSEPNRFFLYIFSQDGTYSNTRVSRLNPATGIIETVVDLPGRDGDRAGGCTITSAWNSTLQVFGAVFQNENGDRLQIHEMAYNTSWISVTPLTSQVPGGSSLPITIHFDPASLLPDVYQVSLQIFSAISDTTAIVPVCLTVYDLNVPQNPREVPAHFALYQNYPNPFNPTTEIQFDLPQTVNVQIKIFNTLGQKVTTLIDELRPAGADHVMWNSKNAAGVQVAAGVYIYQIKAGSFVDAKKMVLIK